MLSLPVREPVLPPPGETLDGWLCALRRVPVRTLPAAHVPEVRTARGKPVVQRGLLRPARGLHGLRRIVALIDSPQGFDDACLEVLGIRLVGVQSVDIETGAVEPRLARCDPLGDRPADPAAGENADRVEPGGDEVVLDLRCLTDDRLQVRGAALRAAEEFLDPGIQ